MNQELWLLWPWLKRGYSLNDARKIRASLIAYRTNLRKTGSEWAGATSSEKLNRFRFSRDKTNQRRKSFLRGRAIIWDREALDKSVRVPEVILDGLNPDRITDWISPFDRRVRQAEINVTDFSFIDNPVRAIETLAAIAELETTLTHGRLNFMDKNCLDVGPYLVLQEMRKGMLPIFRGGKITPSVQAVIDYVNLKKPLHMDFKAATDRRSLHPLPFRSRSAQNRTPERLLLEQKSEAVAGEVVDKINEWLSVLANYELSMGGESIILKFIGEALDNAERHSSESEDEGSWCIAGFMSEHAGAAGKAYRCHLAFLSKGRTIYESMQTGDHETVEKMNHYVRRHSGILKRNFSAEGLATVYALQDGVSRVAEALRAGRGGTGFMDLLGFFASIGQTGRAEWLPKFSIVSGNTCVRIQPPYLVGKRLRDTPSEDGLLPPRELWFNAANSPSAAPEPGFVVALPAKLQGTLITVAWTLDKEALEALV